MLKHGILGLLNYSDMTGYEIMEVFRDSLGFFWKAQTSQIYRELQKLKEQGWATDTCVPQTGKPDKKIFSITESGREELHQWLLEEDIGLESRVPLLMKTFFRGELSADENIAFFKKIQSCCDMYRPELQKPEENIQSYGTVIQDSEKSLYWKMTVTYGVMYMNMLREWSSQCMKELEELNNEHSCD